MAIKNTTVLNPTAKPRLKEISMAPRVHNPDGKVVGFLWNQKPNGDLLLQKIRDQLSQKFNLSGTNWHQKSSGAVPAEVTTIEELARTSDLVINAIGD